MFKRFGGMSLLPVILLLAGMPTSAIQAKPPGLPFTQKDACLEKSPQQEIHSQPVIGETSSRNAKASDGNGVKPEATIVFEFGIDSGAGIFSGIAVSQASSTSQATPAEEVAEGWNRLFDFLGGTSGFFGMEMAAGLALEAPPHSSELSNCPYVQAQNMKSPTKVAPIAADVLDNLGKIEAARKILDQADKERCAGHIDMACRMYQEVQKLCPGSRLDEEAGARLAELRAKSSDSAGAGDEEQEEHATEWWPKGLQMHCKVRLAGLNVTVNLKENGHGSLMIGYETLLGLAWDSALMPLFNVGP